MYLQNCAHNIPEVKLTIVGENPEPLKEYTTSLNIPESNILFTGLQSYETVATILKQSKALVMFSRYENLPCVIIEALCCGLPVISTNVGGIPEMINNYNGVLINNEDENALYNAMEQVYKNYSLFDKVSIAGNAANNYSYKVIGKKISDIYEQTINTTAEKQPG